MSHFEELYLFMNTYPASTMLHPLAALKSNLFIVSVSFPIALPSLYSASLDCFP